MRKIILNLGSGTLSSGCQSIIGEILGEPSVEGAYPSRFSGQLPPAPALAVKLQQWQSLYYARNQDLSLRIHLLQREGLRYSESDFKTLCADLAAELNDWLNSPAFLPIDRVLRSELARMGNAQIILETSDSQLRKLPWHLWQLLEEYSQAELTFSASDWQPLPNRHSASSQARILATFGHSNGLDLAADLSALSELPGAELSALESPSLSKLHEQLWQPQGWDVFFFAGHSRTQGETGVVDLNDSERLTIEQIRHALSKAIENGLKIAIFNSCDGLGLAQQLCDLQIPYIVVMREPVPDYVAQKFLKYLLMAFAAGAPFHLAVREARQRLAGLDNESPCASWLPSIWQNPTARAIYWRDLQGQSLGAVAYAPHGWKVPLFKSVLAGGMVLVLRALGVLEPFELAAYDHLMRSRPAEPVDARLVVVEASGETTSEYGYPLPDEVLTAVIDTVNQSDPMAVGVDLHRGKARPAQGRVATRWQLQQQTRRTIQPSVQPPVQPSTETPNGTVFARDVSVLPGGQPQTTSAYAEFLEQVEQMPNLFLVCAYSSTDENYQVPVQLSESSRLEQVGFSDLPVDTPLSRVNGDRGDLSPDGEASLAGATVRRQLLSYDPDFSTAPSTCTTPYSFSFQLAFEYLYRQGVTPLEVTPDEHWRFGPAVFRSLASRFGGYQKLGASSSQILLNYRTSQPAQKISFEQLLAGNFDPLLLRDRIVLIGYNAPVSKDYFDTPYGPMSGLWVHTHMVSQLVSTVLDERPLIYTLPQWKSWQWGDALWILTWSGLGGYVGWFMVGYSAKNNRGGSAAESATVGLLLLAAGFLTLLLYGICWAGMVSGLWLPLIPSGLATLGAGAAVVMMGKPGKGGTAQRATQSGGSQGQIELTSEKVQTEEG
ncbi:MAG: CHASE2 domain-containing protein [Cyanobacteria bacterium J06623_5]